MNFSVPNTPRHLRIRPLALVAALLLGTLALPAMAQVSFTAAPSPTAGTSPRALTVADLNLDGRADLVVANSWDGTVSILLGNGNGNFRVQTQVNVGGPPYSQPFAVAVADFNGDGKPDLAVANYVNGTASILPGKGDGTFQAQNSFSVGSAGSLSPSPVAIATGDFNRDGRSDVAVANFSDFNAGVLLGNGDGTLRARANFGTGTASIAIAAGDFNDDGRSDLAVANAADGNVSVLPGRGDGTFAPQVTYAAGHQPRAILSADFNGDRRADLAIANRDDNSISVLLANADGTFRAQVTYGTGAAPRGLTSGDFNGDGRVDLAVADSDSNSASVLLGNGNGTFGSRVALPAGVDPHAIASGDFNGDGKADLALANYTCEQCQGSVSVLLNRTTFVNDTVGGTWYDTGSTGQGFTFEVFPDRVGPGRGILAGEWFTYAAGAPDGVEAQRWYSIQGEFPNIQGPTPFLLYQNVGGNFDGPPSTSPTVVGAGLISFDSCTQGRIDYQLDAGGGQVGSIPIQRLVPSMQCPPSGTGTAYPDPGLGGIWYDPANAGQGLFFDVNPNAQRFFGAWYTFAPNGSDIGGPGSQRWYTLQLDQFAPGARSFDDIPIFQTTGGAFGTGTTAGVHSVRVGTASVHFDSCTSATLTYAFSDGSNAGLAGSIPLVRVGTPPASCR